MALMTRWRWALTASMTASCCAPGARAGCWAAGCGALDAGDVPEVVHLRARASARSRAGRHLRRAWAAGAGPGRRAAGRRHGQLRRRGPSAMPSRARATATPASAATTRCSPLAPTAARCCTSGCARDRPTARRGAALRRRADRPRRARRRDRAEAAACRLGVLEQTRSIERLQRAGWQYSIGVRKQHARPRGDRGDPRRATGARSPTTPTPGRRRSPRRRSPGDG